VHFPDDFPYVAADAMEWLLGLGVRLVGVDVPSIDPVASAALDAHHLLFAAGGGVLENLDLAGVEAGRYELCAPPLKVVGGDAAPVRALLRPDEPRA
jgi:arylformamidase